SPEHIPPLTKHRSFHFTDDCVYGAMASGSEQVKRIEQYERRRKMPVYYSFYNPPRVPYQGAVPRIATLPLEQEEPKLGCRVMSAKEVHEILEKLPIGRTPQFCEMKSGVFPTGEDNFRHHGWRLENFIADEMMTCREGRVFEQHDDEDLYALLYERTAPIASLIQVSVDLPPEG